MASLLECTTGTLMRFQPVLWTSARSMMSTLARVLFLLDLCTGVLIWYHGLCLGDLREY